MDDEALGNLFRAQFRAVFQMLRWILEHCGEHCWSDHLAEPAAWQQMVHILWSTDRYLNRHPRERSHKPDFYLDGMERLAQSDWPAAPTREQVRAYLEVVEKKCEARLDRFSLGAPDGKPHFQWTGPDAAQRMIYTLRHAHQHIGWINSRLARAAEKTVDWPIWNEQAGGYALPEARPKRATAPVAI